MKSLHESGYANRHIELYYDRKISYTFNIIDCIATEGEDGSQKVDGRGQ